MKTPHLEILPREKTFFIGDRIVGYRELKEVYSAWEQAYGKGEITPVDYEILADNETLKGCGIISDIDQEHPDTIVIVEKGVTRVVSGHDGGIERVKIFDKGKTVAFEEYGDIIFDILNANGRFIVVPKEYRQ